MEGRHEEKGSRAQTNPKNAKQTVTLPQRPHDDPNNQEALHSLHSALKARDMHDRIRTAKQDASGNIREELKDTCESLDDKTKKKEEEQRVTPPQRRHHGLYNQGATCYLNSVLQVLFMTTEIHDRLNQQTDQELREIFEDLKRKTCKTENITKSLKIENVHEQRDAAECLQKILHHISPQASEVFQGQLRDTTKCSKDHIINEETNPFWTLPLSLKDSNDLTYSVESSFKRTFRTKTYTDDNMMYCNSCKKETEATSRYEMVKAPQILILLLKRFDFDYNTRSHFKSDCCVEVPCELQLKNKTYKLYGMVNHMGSMRGGHYTATVLSEDNTWYECNDDHVSKVKHQLFAEDRTFSSRTVYLLTYRATELKTRNDNEALHHHTEGEEDDTEENSNNKSEGLKETNSKNSCEQRLGEETKTEIEGQGGIINRIWSFFKSSIKYPSKSAACQELVETPSEDLTDKLKEEQGEDIGPEELKRNEEPKTPKKLHVTVSASQLDDAAQQDETRRNVKMDTNDEEKRGVGHSDVAAESQKSPESNELDDLRQDDAEPKRSSVERDADGENKGQIRQNDTDEVQRTSDEASNSQTGGEEGTAETRENNPVRPETEPERGALEQREEKLERLFWMMKLDHRLSLNGSQEGREDSG